MIENGQQVRLLTDSISDFAILTADKHGIINGWNRGAEKVFGYSEEEVIGKPTRILYTPEDLETGVVEKEIAQVLASGWAEDERWHLRKDGSRFYASGIVNSLKEGNEGFVKIARDMTMNKIIEQQKDDFIMVASHELRTPVTSIKAYTEILHDMLLEQNDKQPVELITKLSGQVDRLTALVNELLDTSKITQGLMPLKREQIDINRLISDCIDNLRTLQPNQNLVTELGEVPEISADKERIIQVLNNLLSNAVKYSPQGGDIIVRTGTVGENVEVSVRDSGIGMSAETISKLYQRFYRSSDPKVKTFPGLGLGLYISHEIIKAHGGTLKADSREGEGSVFLLRLPVTPIPPAK